uniref:EamA domain-containing protein n=1 Tax=Eutreptiella gymnastica TaxID=73025 RepID=A0A7S4LLF7_9EUGL
MSLQNVHSNVFGASGSSAASGIQTPVDHVPIMKVDLDVVCDRLNVSTREFVKKLGEGIDKFNIGDPPGSPKSTAMGFGHQDPPLTPGRSPQILSSLMGSQSGRSLLWSRGGSPAASPPMSPGGGFGFIMKQKSGSLTPASGTPPSEKAPLLSSGTYGPVEPHSHRSGDARVVEFLSKEWQLPRARASSYSGMYGVMSYGDEEDYGAAHRSLNASGEWGRATSFSGRSSHLLTDPSLLHQSAFIIPTTDDGPAVVAVPQFPEKQPLKKRLRLPKIPPEISKVELLQRMDTVSHTPRVYLIVNFARPFFGWFILVAGITMMATVGPISNEILALQVDGRQVSGFLLGSWNAQGLVICFGLWAVVSVIMGDWTEATVRYFFSLKGLTLMMVSGVISGAGSGCWTLSFAHTSVEQSYLFNSFHPTLIILCRLLSLKPVFMGEAVGLALGLLGAIISAFTHDDKHTSKLYGDGLAFMSSISLCFYLIASKQVRPHVPLPAMLTVVVLFSAITQTAMAMAVQPTITLDDNPATGVFGYLHPAYFNWWCFMLIVTAIGQAGYIGALKYLTAVVVSICMTMEPAMAIVVQNMIRYVIGQDIRWPSEVAVIGGLIIVLGSVTVSYFSKHHQDGVEVDVTAEAETIAYTDQSGAHYAVFDEEHHASWRPA